MELISLGLGLLVNTCVKNKAVNTAIDDFVTDSVKWVKGWFKKTDNSNLIQNLEAAPESPEVKKEVGSALEEMVKNPDFKTEFMRWIEENKKPNPSIKNVITKKNVLEDSNIEVHGNIKIGDKEASNDNYDQKNVVKNTIIKGGGDFTLGDG